LGWGWELSVFFGEARLFWLARFDAFAQWVGGEREKGKG
jgi:hypothetical protein